MNHKRDQAGNMLIMLISMVGFIILVAFLVLNYNTLIVTQKEAQTAIDAAALQAAKDMARVVVDGPHGRLALVDDPSGDSKWPVQGVNTVLATLRLDAIIADKLGNKTILYLVKNDLAQTQAAVQLLKTKLASSASGGPGAYDRYGKPVNIRDSAYEAYMANQARLAGTQDPPKNFKVIIGRMKDTAGPRAIGIAVPNPENVDSITYGSSNSMLGQDSRKYYLADYDYPVAGNLSNIRFGFVAGAPSLVENSVIEDAVGLNIPVLAQVTAEQPVQKMAEVQDPELQKQKEKSYLGTVATAQVGNRILLSAPGVLEVAFSGGVPAEGPNGSPSFKSVKTIMNSSQIDSASPDGKSPYNGWAKDTPGIWYKAQGGPVWGSGSIVAGAFKGISGREDDDPSVALSFFAYDWLRSLAYRPNAQAVIDALGTPFAQIGASAGSQQIFAGRVDDLLQPAYAETAGSAVTTGVLFIIPGEFSYNQVLVNGQWLNGIDVRNLKQYDNNPEAYQRQHSRMWGYVPADGVMPPSTAMVKIEPAWWGPYVMTMDGNPYWHLQAYIDRLQATNSSAAIMYQAVANVIDDTVKADPELRDLGSKISAADMQAMKNQEMSQTYHDLGYDGISKMIDKGTSGTETPLTEKYELRKQEVVGKLFRDKPKVLAALINATYAAEITSTMLKHMKTLTGGGVKLVTGTNYVVSGANFYPPALPYSGVMAMTGGYTNVYVTHAYQGIRGGTDYSQEIAHIKGQMLSDQGTLPTGQEYNAPGAKDWLALPKNEGGKAVSQLQFFKHTTEPVIGKQEKATPWMVPALAQSAAPPAKLIYHFRIADGSLNALPGTQKVVLQVDKVSKYSNVPTSKGQVIYQTTTGLVAPPTAQNPTVMYQVQGRDLYANAYPSSESGQSDPSAAADYFDKELVAAWAITCPVLPPQRVPVPPAIDLFQMAQKWCGGGGGSQAFNLFEFAGYPFLFSTIVEGDPSMQTPWGSWQVRRYGAVITSPPPPPQYIT